MTARSRLALLILLCAGTPLGAVVLLPLSAPPWLIPAVVALGALGAVELGLTIRRLGARAARAESEGDVRLSGRLAAEEALALGEVRYRSLVSAMADGVVVQNAAGLIETCNPAAERILGLSAEQMSGRASVDPRWRAVRDDGSPFPGEQHPSMVTLRTGLPQKEVTMGVHKPDGSLTWISISTEPIALGDEISVVACFTEITERRRTQQEQATLRRIATMVAAEAEPDLVFERISQEVAEIIGAETAGVIRFDETRSSATVVGAWSQEGLSRPRRGDAIALTAGSASTVVASTGKPARIQDHDTFAGHPEWAALRCRIAAPILVGGELWGTIAAGTTKPDPLPLGAEDSLGALAELAALAIKSVAARDELATLASTDHLTGLWNRRAFQLQLTAEIARVQRSGRALSLVVLDLDHFKRVNDLFGHPAGDRVLLEVATRLSASVREGEIVARVGGEEFAWILPETDGATAFGAAERVRRAIAARPFPGVGPLTASFGVCDLTEGSTAEEIFHLADTALYWAKEHGRDRVFRYSGTALAGLPVGRRGGGAGRSSTPASLQALARALEAKDPATHRHSERVAELAEALARAAGWTDERAALLYEAAYVHDVGKIAIPEAILMKPGRLTHDEYSVVKEHSVIGAGIVADVLTPEQTSWIRGHHEHHDGNGYPDGLAGDAIPDGARLLAVADGWDAMTTARPYGPPLSARAGLEECRRVSGTQFDPEAVAALEFALASHTSDLLLGGGYR